MADSPSIHDHDLESADGGPERPGKGGEQPDSNSRWTAAIGYVSILCLIPYFLAGSRPFVLFHAKQGLLLFLAEIAVAIFLWVLDGTLGRIPFLGILVVGLMQLAVLLLLLALAILGFMRAISGEKLPLPWIGQYAEDLPDPPMDLG